MNGVIRVGPLLMLPKPVAGQEGIYVASTGLTGWFDSLAPRRTVVARSTKDGDFDVPSTLDARTVSITGLAIAADAQRLEHYRDLVTGAVGNESVEMSVEYSGLTTTAKARLGDSGVKFAPKKGGSRFADFQLPLYCPDGRRYGNQNVLAAVPLGAQLVAVHYGNYKATSVVTVAGTMPSGYTVYGPAGKTFVVTQPVVAGHPHLIDMATGYVRIDGAIVLGVVTHANTWCVPKGASVPVIVAAPAGTGTFSLTTRDTYI